jgi:hypothetical protein
MNVIMVVLNDDMALKVDIFEEELKSAEIFLEMQQCRQSKDQALSTGKHALTHRKDKRIEVLISGLRDRGLAMTSDQIKCIICSDFAHGAFIPETKQIYLCSNNVTSRNQLSDVLTHELVHAYDYSDPKICKDDLEKHACSEIRAINLAGDCSMLKEFLGGHFRLQGMFEVGNFINL